MIPYYILTMAPWILTIKLLTPRLRALDSGALELDLLYYITKNGKSPCRIMYCFQASFIALDFPLMWQRTSLYWKKQTSVTSVKHTIKICSLTRWRTFLKRLAKRAADLVHGGNASSSCNHAKGPDLIGLIMEAPLHLTHQDFKTHCTTSLKRLSNLNLQCKTPVNTSGKPKVPCHIQFFLIAASQGPFVKAMPLTWASIITDAIWHSDEHFKKEKYHRLKSYS